MCRATASHATPALPVALQVELLVKLAGYDKGLRARAGGDVRVLVVTRAGDQDSERLAEQLISSLSRVERIAELPHHESRVSCSVPSELVAICKAQGITIAYLTPELGSDAVAAIGEALDGVNVLTMTSSADLVRRGVVLGFDLVSAKPKLFLNLTQARRQGITMAAEVMKLMTIFQ